MDYVYYANIVYLEFFGTNRDFKNNIKEYGNNYISFLYNDYWLELTHQQQKNLIEAYHNSIEF